MKENRNYLFKNANIYVDKNGHSYAVDKDGNIIGTKGVSYQLPEITISPKVSTPWEAAQLTSKRNPNWRQTYDMSPSLEALNAVTAGTLNWVFSPTTAARILWDASQGNFEKAGKGVVYGNNGVFTDNYAAKHPWISLGGNMALDILSPLAWGKATKLAARAGKGIVDEFRRQVALNTYDPVLGMGVKIANSYPTILGQVDKIANSGNFVETIDKTITNVLKNFHPKPFLKNYIKAINNRTTELNKQIDNLEEQFNKLDAGSEEYAKLNEAYQSAQQKKLNIAKLREKLGNISPEISEELQKDKIESAINKARRRNVDNMTDEDISLLESEVGQNSISRKSPSNQDNIKASIEEFKKRKNTNPKTTDEDLTNTQSKTIDVDVSNSTTPEQTPQTTLKQVDVTPEVNTTSNTQAVVTETPQTTVQQTTSVPTTETIPTDEIVEQATKQADNVLPHDLPYYTPNGNTYVIQEGTKITKEGDNLFAKDNFGNKIRIYKKPNGDYNISEGPQKGFSSEMADNLLDTEKYKYATIKGNNDGTFTFGYKPVSKFYSLYTTSTKPGKASQLWDVLMGRLSKNPTKTESGVYPKITNNRLGFNEADMPEKGTKFIPGGRQFSIPRALGSTLGLGYLFGGRGFINNYIQPTAKTVKNYYVEPSENGAASGWNQDITSLEGVPMDTFHVGKDIYGVPNVKFNIKDGEYIQESNGKYYQMYPLREMDNSFTPKGEAVYGTINSANKYQFPNEANRIKNAPQSYTPTNVTKASSLPSVGEDTIQTTQQTQQQQPQQKTQQQQPQQKTQQQKNQEIIGLMGFINRTNPLYKIINNYA